jgi:hypothetical protein
VLLAFLATLVWADESLSTDEITSHFNGTNGEMRLAYAAAKGKTMQCQLKWSWLVEKNMGVGGPDVEIIPEDSETSGLAIAWKTATNQAYTYDGEAHFEYGSQQRVMEVHAYIGSADKDITVWQNRVHHAYAHQLKWTFRFRVNASEPSNEWSWTNSEGELCVGVTMGCYESEAERLQERSTMQHGTAMGCQENSPISVGGRGKMVSAAYAYVDGTTERAMNSTRIRYRQRAQNTYSFSWCFPHFTTELMYDPTVSLVPIVESSNLAVIIGATVGGVVGLAMVAGLVFYCRRGNKRRTVA